VRVSWLLPISMKPVLKIAIIVTVPLISWTIAKWIYIDRWTARCVLVQIYPACKFDRVFADKSLEGRVVISGAIVVEPGSIILPAYILRRIAARSATDARVAKRIVS